MSSETQDLTEHFAHCIQVLGGATSASRRLGIDERAIRRFTSGERPVSISLMADTAKALQALIAEATSAEGHIATVLAAQPNRP